MLKGENLLNGDLSVGGLVKSGDDSSVCTLSEAVEDLVVVA